MEKTHSYPSASTQPHFALTSIAKPASQECCNNAALKRLVWGMKMVFLMVLLCIGSGSLTAQTDFAPGEIMFTGYNSYEIAAESGDAFSIVLLKDAVASTVIYITDRGWSNTTGFRNDSNGEGTISFTMNTPYPCGTVFVFRDIAGTNDWVANDEFGNVVGSVAIQAGGDIDGIELGTAGDQLLIYQLPTPTAGNQASFVCMIQMDNNLIGGVDTDEESQLPSGLTANDIVRFNVEVDNAKYDCTPNVGTSLTLQTEITNDNGAGGLKPDASNNWVESNIQIPLLVACSFCCGSSMPPLPILSSTGQVNVGDDFTIFISGNLPMGQVWELYANECGVGTPLQTTTEDFFNLTAPGTETTLVYYIRASNSSSCDCSLIQICVENDPIATCTSCLSSPDACGDCFLPPPLDNPDLDSGCYEIKMIFILDESGSIGGNAQDVEDGVLAFLDALNGQDIQLALIEFSGEARTVFNYTPINNALILAVEGYFNGTPLNGHTYNPNGGTNWHDAMIKADALMSSDILMFFTDGIPTGWNTTFQDCGNGSTTQTPEIVNPVKLANKLKGEGTHMFMLGVGGGIDAQNLQYMSGYDEYVNGVNTIGTSDYSIGNFQDLADDLADFVSELCFSPLELDKQLFGSVCNNRQQFMFIIHNPGTESAVTIIQVFDTLPSGFTNIMYSGPPVKLCIGAACAGQGQPMPDDAFIWTTNSLPPGESDTLILSVEVVPNGNYTNIAWANASNAAYVSDTVTSPVFVDDLPPVITCPAGVTIDCAESSLPDNTGFATAIDPDGSAPDVTYTDVTMAGTCPILYTINRTWEARDGCFNIDDCMQTITVLDTEPPMVSCPANVTLSCIENTLPAATGLASGTDNCEGNLDITFTDATMSGSCPQEYTIQRTWTATDGCANTATCMQTITIDDTAGPVITCPANVTINCAAITLPANTGTATASDLCDGSPAISFLDATINGSCPQNYTIQRTWRAQDDCGTLTTCVQNIVVRDEVAPTINCPANITIGCGESTATTNTGNATGTDACSGTAAVTYVDYSAEPPGLSEFMRWIYLPQASSNGVCNSGTNCEAGLICIGLEYTPNHTGTLTTYTTGFLLNCHNGNDPVTSNISCQMVNNSSTLTDCGVSGLVLMNSSGNAGSLPITANVPIVIHQVCFQLDAGVILSIDEDEITNLTTSIDLPGGGFVSETPAYATYVLDVDALCSPDACQYPSTIYRKFIATDGCGNKNSCIQEIEIQDVTPPIIACPANVTIACGESTLPANTGQPMTSDFCDGAPEVTYSDVTTASPVCPQEYTITRTWRSEDGCGNFVTCIQTIVIDDSLAPVLNCPANVTIECTESTLPANTGMATATDNCDLSPEVMFSDVTAAGACANAYTVSRTWQATDDCGNISTCLQTIQIIDSTLPTVSCPVDITVQCDQSTLPVNTGMATGSDNCDLAPEVTYTDMITAGVCPQAYTITRTWQVTDDCNNSTVCIQLIEVVDTTAPDVTCPSDITIQCTASTLPANTGTSTATDNCDASPDITFSDVTSDGSCPQAYMITRSWTATDECSNINTCVQVITIIDTGIPMITCPSNVTIECTASTLPANTGMATATDNCDANPVITWSDVNGPAGDCPQEYVISRTWMVEDACGNTSTCVQLISIDDSTAPSLTCPANTTIECTASTLPANTGNATSSDNCDPSPTVTYDDVTIASPTCLFGYTITRTWTSTDDCGNSTTCTQTIVVDDSVAPEIDCPADVTVVCTESTLPPDTGEATATDNCDPNPDVEFIDITMNIPGSDGYQINRTWTATDVCGNDASCTQIIIVTNPLDPEILGLPFDTICSGESVVFEAEDQGISPITYAWTFGSGANPPNAMGIGPHNVVYTYNGTNGTIGAFVVLTVTTPGCPPVTDTVSNIHVNAIPNAAISVTGGGCVLADYFFQPQAPEMPGYTYTWNFGTGASIPNAVGYGPHTVFYLTTEMRTVSLMITSNEAGASCSASSTVNITPDPCFGNIFGRVFLETTTPDTMGIQNVNLRLYRDQNLDGIRDDNTIIKNVFTNASGNYTMTAVIPGYYVIEQTQPNPYISLWEDDVSEDFDSLSNIVPNDNILPVTVEPGELDRGNFFVEIPVSGIITGYVFEDFNNNQTPQSTEGIGGVTISLYTDNNTDGIPDNGGLVATTLTSGIGYYTFGGLAVGHYVLVETQPAGYNSVKDFDPTNDGDVVPNTNMTNDTLPVSITIAEVDETNYFIEISPCGQVVTTASDHVPGSLRAAIECADPGDTITFHPGLANQTLIITGERIAIQKNLFIHSSISPPLMIQSNTGGAFYLSPGNTVEFKNLQFTSGLSGYPGVAFDNKGHLILWDVKVYPNPLLTPGNYLIFNQTPGMLTTKGYFQVYKE